MSWNVKSVLSSLSRDDYEEAQLLHRFGQIMSIGADRLAEIVSRREKGINDIGLLKDEQAERLSIIAKLGYDPVAGRKARPRGPARSESIPSPLPTPGTELRSCLGDTYKIFGYACLPRLHTQKNVVLYEYDGALISRSLANFFASALGTGEPIVTWPDDPRKLQPGKAVSAKFRRTMTDAQLKAEREAMDPDTQWARETAHKRY